MRIPALVGSLLTLALAALAAAAQLPRTAPREVRLEGPAPAVFEELGKLYGVKVRVDPELPRRTLKLRLDETDFASALRIATRVAGAFWVAQPDGSLLVAQDTPQNRQALQPQLLHTFHLPGRSPEELTEAVRLLREVLDMRLIRSDPDSGTLTVRDTPFRLRVAEQLLAQLEPPPAEVWLDVVLLEVDRERALALGLLPPDQIVIVHLGAGALAAREGESLLDIVQFLLDRGLLPPALSSQIGFDISTGQVTVPPFVLFGGGATLFAANFPDVVLNFQETRRVFRALRRFQLRARHAEPASLFAGELFPITFTTFSSIFIPEIVQQLQEQGLFVPPVPAIRQEELGTRVTATPRVHSSREISLRLEVTQEALTGEDLNGIPILSTRALEQQVRLREGETLLLGGLRARTREQRRTQTPLLGSVPFIGHLFKRTQPRTATTELLILVTPRLVLLPRAVARRPLYVGTERDFAPPTTGPVPAARPIPQPPPPQQPQPPQQ